MSVIIERHLTPALVAEARAAADAVHANLPATPNYTGLCLPERFFFGYVGEFVVRDWLAESHKPFEHRVVTNGRSQRAEFIVQLFGKRKRLEVKTRSRERHQEFLIPVAQGLDFDIAIAVRLALPRNAAQIMGVIGRKNVSVLPTAVFPGGTKPARWKLLRDLVPASQLLELLDDDDD